MAEQESLLSPEERELVEHPKRHNLEPFRDSYKTRTLRLWLNIIFMILAVAGLIVYFNVGQTAGMWVLAIGCVFKFIELGLRILKI